MVTLPTNLTGTTPQGSPTSPTHSVMHNELHKRVAWYSPGPPTGNAVIDTAAMLACRNQAAADNTKIMLDNGTYLWTEPLESFQYMNLEGQGRGVTAIQADASFTGDEIIHIQNGQTGAGGGVRICNLSINGLSNVTDCIGIEGWEFTVDNVGVAGGTRSGIRLYRTDTWTMYNWKIVNAWVHDNATYGIFADSSDQGVGDGFIHGCEIYDNGSYGIYLDAVSITTSVCHLYHFVGQATGWRSLGINNAIISCDVESHTTVGLSVISGANHTRIIGNAIRSNATGLIVASGALDTEVVGGNQFWSNSVIDWTDAGTGTIIQGNTPETVNRYFKVLSLPASDFHIVQGTPDYAGRGGAGTYFQRWGWAFDGAADETIHHEAIRLPAYRTGSKVEIQLDLAPSQSPADASQDEVLLNIQIVSISSGIQVDTDPFGGAPAQNDGLVVVMDATGEQRQTQAWDSVFIPTTELLKLNIARLATNVLDTYNAKDMWFFEMRMTYESYRP